MKRDCGPQPCDYAPGAPRELQKAILPSYTIEPPDLLTIDAVHLVPKSPYELRALDVVALDVQGTLPEAPISGVYRIEPGGVMHLGGPYGSLPAAGLNLDEFRAALETHLRVFLREPQVSVTLAEFAAKQHIAGQHMVAPDGTVTLGTYGSVMVVGQTVGEAKANIEAYLSQYLDHPEVSVSVFAYNSRFYYVISQDPVEGDVVYRFPVTGNETVLDALSQVAGLRPSSSWKMWVARPGRDARGCNQILPVNYAAITQSGAAETNYQLLPGDRVYVAEDRLIAIDTQLAKLFAPLERVMGFTLLGVGTVTRLSGRVLAGGGNPNGSF